jgi:hypothetical protein
MRLGWAWRDGAEGDFCMCGIKKKPQKLRPAKSCGKVAAAKAGGGNAGLWKAWENDKTVFPTLPTDLGNR